MGNPVIWLSGAQSKILARCPTERPKYIGIGSAILITGGMAGVSMTFALNTALKTPLSLAIPLAVAWSLAIMSLDRWLVVSLQRDENKLKYLSLASVRLLLAVLFGLIISTPVVLQIFRPEIVAEIPVIQRENTAAYYHQAASDAISQQIKRDNAQIKAATITIQSSGQPNKNIAHDPQIRYYRRQKNQAAHNESSYYYKWQHATDPTFASLMHKNYITELDRWNTAISQINSREALIRAGAKKAAAEAQVQLTQAQAQLKTDEIRQQQFLANVNAGTKNDTGLLIRLQALDALARNSSTVWTARLLLLIFFTVIECLPVIVKVLLNLGPPNRYEIEVAKEAELQAGIAEHRRALRKRQGFIQGEGITRAADRLRLAMDDPNPQLDKEAAAAAHRVAKARLRDWEKREMEDIVGTAGTAVPPSPKVPAVLVWAGQYVSAMWQWLSRKWQDLLRAWRYRAPWRSKAPLPGPPSPYGAPYSPNGRTSAAGHRQAPIALHMASPGWSRRASGP